MKSKKKILNKKKIISSLPPNRTELVIGLVVPTGTDLKNFKERLKAHFEDFHYETDFYKLSELLQEPEAERIHGVSIETDSNFHRIKSLMDAGDEFRAKGTRGDALALYTVAKILSKRGSSKPSIRPGVVHVLESLKHPDEAATLRQVYGAGFFLLGLYRSESERQSYLQGVRHLNEDEATELLTRDQSGHTTYGQRTRDTFELADAFINLDDEVSAYNELNRIVDLIFGHPFHTPTLGEYAMFMAYVASFSSADLSRQVGAVVVSPDREVIASGMNEVPRPGGGRYFTGDEPDRRDFQVGFDSNAKKKDDFISSILSAVKDGGTLTTEVEDKLRELVRNKFSPTEFGRPVHAEMAALLACARIGVSPRGCTLYTTTFPCHNCAKHIIEAGIRQVIYVEPYPKSLALELHDDAIVLGPIKEKDSEKRVIFEPFVGIAARHYVDLFSMRLSSGSPIERKVDSFHKTTWSPESAAPRMRMTDTTYIEREEYFARQIIKDLNTNATGKKSR